jgi:signal transduction histidine kinase
LELKALKSKTVGSGRRAAWLVLVALSIGTPALLVLHAVRATAELREMRLIYLRDRAAAVAARLESSTAPEAVDLGALSETEPALVDVQILDTTDPEGRATREGRELFRTELAGGIFRAYVPAHRAGELRVARIDLNADAPNFLLVHAQHNVMVTAVGAAALILLASLAMSNMKRAERLDKQRVENERLAQLGAMSAVLAHEIRNPLGAIKGFAQLAREGADARATRPLDAIVRESKRLEKLVNSLLVYGRPSQPVIRRTSWTDLASGLEAQARELIGRRPVSCAVSGEVPAFETDPDLLEQALLNLIRNAIDAIPAGEAGSVIVTAGSGPGAATTISVEDDGCGLPDEVRARLFTPFVTTKASGAGLGLSISKKIADSLGGTLTLIARTPRGTRAELSLHGTTSHR